MRVVTFDAETFYDREYSLSKITTEEYVRSPQFELIGFAIKVDDGPTRWVPQAHVKDYIATFDWSDAMVVCQNTAFDGAILHWHYGVKPAVWADTLGMSRALYPHEKSHSLKAQTERAGIGAKGDEVLNAIGKRYADFSTEELARYAAYCINDVELTYKLFTKYVEQGFPKGELKLVDLTLRMFIEPVLELDKSMLELHLHEVLERKETLLTTVRDTMLADAQPDFVALIFSEGTDGIKKLLMSNEKFAVALGTLGVAPPLKISLTTGRIAYAFAKTDDAFKALQEYPDDRVQALVAARLGNKTTLEETRTQRFIGMSDRGKFPVPLRYYGAHSGRWSGCLVADTQVTVYDPVQGVVVKRITNVLADDLVWDGVEFVAHEGVQFSGFQEVITWDGITGTPDHVVFTDAGEISLRDAMQGAHRIQTARSPGQDAVDAAREFADDDQR
jgi:hypothetical protein